MSDSERDQADMIRLAAGQDVALNELMERHGPKLFSYLLRSLQNEEDAADLAQETFVRVYQNRAKFDAHQRFSTWLYAIATNLVKDRFRYRSRHPQVSIDAESEASGRSFSDTLQEQRATPRERAQTGEMAELVKQALGALPEELRTPLILSEYEELSQAEIAAVLHCSVKAVEMRIYRARQQLRAVLSPLLEEIG